MHVKFPNLNSKIVGSKEFLKFDMSKKRKFCDAK